MGDLKAVTTDFIIDSIALVMEDKGSPSGDLKKFLTSLIHYKGLELYSLDIRDKIRATDEMSKKQVDFDDATSVAAMRRLSLREIVSFDKDFDKVQGITRLEPRSLLG